MIAQTMVEYSGLQSISAAFANAVRRLEQYIGSGNSKYLLMLAGILLILFLWMRCRRN